MAGIVGFVDRSMVVMLVSCHLSHFPFLSPSVNV